MAILEIHADKITEQFQKYHDQRQKITRNISEVANQMGTMDDRTKNVEDLIDRLLEQF